MKKFNFVRKQVNVATLTAHPILVEWGFDFQPDEHFARLLKIYGLYEMPVIDSNGNVITHLAEVLAAIENGESYLDVYVIDMDEMDLKLFICLKHKYSQKEQVKSYEAAKFFRDYLKNSDDGKELAKTLPGDINEKVGQLMQTSDSTIKRLLKVGDSKPEYLGMIDNGNLSFHDAESEIKVEKLTTQHKKNLKKRKDGIKAEDLSNADSSDNLASSIEIPINQFHVDDTIVSYGTGNGKPFIEVGGIQLKNVIYLTHVNNSSEHGVTVSHIFQEQKPNGRSIQVTIENFSKAA